MLNEDQFIFAITLSRNTPQAVAAKQAAQDFMHQYGTPLLAESKP